MNQLPYRSGQASTSLISDTQTPPKINESDTPIEPIDMHLVTIEDEFPQDPSIVDIWKTVLSPQTLLVALPYLCSFGSELAVEGIISNFYVQTAKTRDNMVWSSQTAGNWAAMFGLLNVITRSLGGSFLMFFYRHKGLSARKWWLIFVGALQGIFFIWIGFTNLNVYSLIGAMTGLAIFMDAANGAIFALVSAIYPSEE